MEPIIGTIAAAAVSLLASFLKSSGEGFSRGLGDDIGSRTGNAAWKKAKQLLSTIKARFSSKPQASKVMEAFENAPQDEDTQATVRFHLKQTFASDETFMKEVSDLLKEFAKAGGDTYFKTNISGSVGKIIQLSNIHGGIGNVEGNVIIQPSTAVTNATALKRSVQLIKGRDYDAAIDILKSSIKEDPSEPDAYYYLALAMLRGRRPKILYLSEADTISQNLENACSKDSTRAHYYYLWALVKLDFYMTKGLSIRPPDVNELLAKAGKLRSNPESMSEMLSFLPRIASNPILDLVERRVALLD